MSSRFLNALNYFSLLSLCVDVFRVLFFSNLTLKTAFRQHHCV